MLRRSQLYVPGNNEKMIAKAAGLEADSVILDLEDAVPEELKQQARQLITRLSSELDWGKRELCVRINPNGSKHFSGDIAAVQGCRRIDSVVIPKAVGNYSSLHARTGKGLIPIVETAAGLMNIRKIASTRGIVAITYGAADYAASVGGAVSAYLESVVIKTMVVAAAATVGVDALDNVFFDLDDTEGFRKEAKAARALGYAGKQVVHPSQIAIANEVFSPTREEVEWAEKVLGELGNASARARGASRVDGALVDAVHYRLAKGIIERAKQTEA